MLLLMTVITGQAIQVPWNWFQITIILSIVSLECQLPSYLKLAKGWSINARLPEWLVCCND